MNQYYKIKIGIEEYPIEEKDIARITEAMQKNDMVKLEHGIFRGNAILAVCRDLEREKKELLIGPVIPPTQEEIEQEKLAVELRERRLNCEICEHKGLKEVYKDGKVVRVPCDCQNIELLN